MLDRTLRGDLFESTVIGFLAALAIDAKKQILVGACSFTPNLPALVKVAQMLVRQASVLAMEQGEIEYPADMLDEMKERFMMVGTPTPFSWALRLRVYGKKIRNSTTCLGVIRWSEDNEKLTYGDIELTMTSFKDFVREQVHLAQAQLGLLPLHPTETWENLI